MASLKQLSNGETKVIKMTKQEFESKMKTLNLGIEGMTREGYEVYQREVNALTDAYLGKFKTASVNAHDMATLEASWG